MISSVAGRAKDDACSASGAQPSPYRLCGGGVAVRCSTSGTVAAGLVIYESGYLPVGRAHANALVALQRLALGLQRRRDHHLRAVELREVLVAAGRHRRTQPAEQVERPIVLVRRPDENLFERPVLRG